MQMRRARTLTLECKLDFRRWESPLQIGLCLSVTVYDLFSDQLVAFVIKFIIRIVHPINFDAVFCLEEFKHSIEKYLTLAIKKGTQVIIEHL
ncbi:protein of unknown function [Shewanella benthica]|uniref:Uncharacterized protein n=1 Tax=Shewanella benthica TaxID=43661 RepID=A0A330M833_9GAMM|nr:protein of unknown function [Shewanella benthica]